MVLDLDSAQFCAQLAASKSGKKNLAKQRADYDMLMTMFFDGVPAEVSHCFSSTSFFFSISDHK
jgi:hypothetical protein